MCGYEVRKSCEVSPSVTSTTVSNIEIPIKLRIYTTTIVQNYEWQLSLVVSWSVRCVDCRAVVQV